MNDEQISKAVRKGFEKAAKMTKHSGAVVDRDLEKGLEEILTSMPGGYFDYSKTKTSDGGTLWSPVVLAEEGLVRTQIKICANGDIEVNGKPVAMPKGQTKALAKIIAAVAEKATSNARQPLSKAPQATQGVRLKSTGLILA